MRIGTWCVECVRNADGVGRLEDIQWVPFTTKSVARFTCPSDHDSLIAIADGAHSLLFHRAIVRLVEGHPRDAIIDAHTALEMFLSHVPARARYDRTPGASPRSLRRELVKETGKSERARAAALAVVSLVSNRAPPSFPEKVSELRNDAVHKGDYPSALNTEKAIIQVDDFVREVEGALAGATCANEVSYWRAAHQEEVVSALEDPLMQNRSFTHVVLRTALSTAVQADNARLIIAQCRERRANGDLVAHVR